jgi:uncharacterized protein (UPF0276 family)
MRRASLGLRTEGARDERRSGSGSIDHGEMSEPEFLNRLCDEADCGMLVDVTNL